MRSRAKAISYIFTAEHSYVAIDTDMNVHRIEPSGQDGRENRHAARSLANTVCCDSSPGRRIFQLFDVEFEVLSDRPGPLRYIDAFMHAYQCGSRCHWLPRATRTARLKVTTGKGIPGAHESRVAIHSSGHQYWNTSGYLVRRHPWTVDWPDRQVEVTLVDDGGDANIASQCNAPDPLVGEAAFHVCRSLAIYCRTTSLGYLLHASAIVTEGKAILFIGGTAAGKTTLLLEACINGDAVPLSNDRVWVTGVDQVIATSWPSYASFCEGTILAHGPLHRQALWYETAECTYRTLSWPQPLRNDFTKACKRIFPMVWFTDCIGREYAQSAPIQSIIFPSIAVAHSRPRLAPIDLSDTAGRHKAVQLLRGNDFDCGEPSFRPWLGLTIPSIAAPIEVLVERLYQQDVRFFELQLSVANLPQLRETLRLAIDR
jgi:hypothetical protein